MLSSKNIIIDIKDVPQTWIFEYYCKLDEKLTGQSVKIRSLFNKETIASMCIYPTESGYKFKDFSSGNQGNGCDLISKLYTLSFSETFYKIKEDYTEYLKTHSYIKEVIIPEVRYRVTSYRIADWYEYDAKFWTQFNIGIRMLKRYNVKPLYSYIMTKENNPDIFIKRPCIYGYFTNNGTLYKIYQPKIKDKKFIKVDGYLQGTEQLENKPNLLITSSLKDVMSLKSLDLNIDVIASDSENTIIDEKTIEEFRCKYNNIAVMFDNDDPGIKAMKIYKERYNIHPVWLRMSKDVSDSIKDYGVKNVLYNLVPLLNNAYN